MLRVLDQAHIYDTDINVRYMTVLYIIHMIVLRRTVGVDDVAS